MKNLWLLIVSWCFLSACAAQHVNTAKVFAHNDYATARPFFAAYELKVGFIEADVFLVDGELLVAHEWSEIDSSKTLEQLYLKPLKRAVVDNNGKAFNDGSQLTLMIDLKTEGVPTLDALVQLLQQYSPITSSTTVTIMISGNVPDPNLWDKYPRFIFFDGRPGNNYSKDQWERIAMISTSFRSHVKWDGRGALPPDVKKKIKSLMQVAHERGKKFRFWATPDFENAWRGLLNARMDVIVTDRPAELVAFMAQQQY